MVVKPIYYKLDKKDQIKSKFKKIYREKLIKNPILYKKKMWKNKNKN